MFLKHLDDKTARFGGHNDNGTKIRAVDRWIDFGELGEFFLIILIIFIEICSGNLPTNVDQQVGV